MIHIFGDCRNDSSDFYTVVACLGDVISLQYYTALYDSVEQVPTAHQRLFPVVFSFSNLKKLVHILVFLINCLQCSLQCSAIRPGLYCFHSSFTFSMRMNSPLQSFLVNVGQYTSTCSGTVRSCPDKLTMSLAPLHRPDSSTGFFNPSVVAHSFECLTDKVHS